MVVRLDEGRDAVRAYVHKQAALGLHHVRSLVQADRDAMAAMVDDLTEAEADFEPAPGEFSVSQVLQHLNASFPRSPDRLRSLSRGRPFRYDGATPRSGGIADEMAASWEHVRGRFFAGEDEVLTILASVDERVGLDLTADHAEYGAFNWLEWATYSHHVHTHDHVGQASDLRRRILEMRTRP